MKKNYVLPEGGQELRPKHVEAIVNQHTVHQAGIKYYICNRVARKMYNFKKLYGLSQCIILITLHNYEQGSQILLLS
jgi:hypothetical protein